ncbi:hypothetical protein PHLGIDRAFT_126585 [Phlebiopsis gigantea 11061_1 CR5-6]|uniref:Uncharacterized protein n=1 Tax=Phlebiopsis gigantea (strain 11061_1 CR5-6) TaxID=745531 RepID=A0A0C3SCV0_PHLG1|nr:hypothetical protein PHLGIDRAFT_126585 [Phlebiopsis gigantea 11061_1 CR5-6]
MNGEALADASNVESGPSSPGTSSDSDAVNTSTSRVYFGPIQPAERRLTRARDSLQNTPIRRSPRHHADSVSQSEDGEGSPNDVMASDLSRPDTPMLTDDVLEEPPSALATKVMRAWDNPSPPPSPHASPRPLHNEDEFLQLVTDAGPSLADSDAEMDTDGAFDPVGKAAANEQPQGSSAPASLPRGHFDETDLINFDSFTTALPSDTPAVQLMPATPPLGAPYTVDDLLASTPLRPPQGFEQVARAPNAAQEGDLFLADLKSPSHEDTASVDEEAQVLIALSSEPKDVTAPSSPQVSTVALENPEETSIPATLLEPALHTPLRRSTRPRRSVSPYFLPLTSPSKLPDSAQSSPSQPKIEVGPARRRKIKVKEQDDEKVDLVEIPQESPGKNLVDIVLEDVELPAPTLNALPADDKGKGKGPEAQQRLGSLSPTSTNLLMQLLPAGSAQEPTTPAVGVMQPIDQRSNEEQRPTTPVDATPAAVDTHVRPSTPIRNGVLSQPARDVTRTPARRVPISQAIGQGIISPVKPSAVRGGQTSGATGFQAAFLGAPVFKPRAPEDSLRSPAKRVPIAHAQAMSSLQSPAKPSGRPASPVKSTHARSLSEDPIQPAVHRVQRSMSADLARPAQLGPKGGDIFKKLTSTQHVPVRSSQASNEPSTSTLPFSIPPSIQEMDEPQPQGLAQPSKPAIVLRPPTGKTESKIPRPGSKPYVRPTAASGVKQIPKPAATLPKKTVSAAPAPPAARPMRMVRKVMSKPVEISSGSEDNVSQAVAGPGPRTVASRSARPIANDMGSPGLKRKRDTEESTASPSGVRPIFVRKVPPAPKHRAKTSDSSPMTRAGSVESPGPTVVQGKIRMRKVIDKKKPKSPPRSPPNKPMDVVQSPPTIRASLQPSPPPPTPTSKQAADAPTDTTNLPQATVSTPESEAAESIQPTVPLPSVPFQPSINVESEPESSQGLRRTTRSRKSAQNTTDVFGTVAAPRAQTRRRPTIVLSDNSVFSGMTALALKSLTTTNTQRNQKQVAEIQMEVVIKDGKRPDSPTTKVRTSLERQREELAQQRQERAERRARRSIGEGDSLDADAAEQGDDADVNMSGAETGGEEPPRRHRRGPGEDEDFETPERPERPAKRTRLDDGQGENLESKNEKRVKWDHGLATTVYLDDTPPKPKRHTNDVVPKRGALAPSAKKLPLDTMGNVLNADAPIVNVRPENIVVKKFVYEDDAAAVPEPPPAPAPKPTRSKSKKSRS